MKVYLHPTTYFIVGADCGQPHRGQRSTTRGAGSGGDGHSCLFGQAQVRALTTVTIAATTTA